MITTFDLDEYVYAALRAGARGFLLKDAGADAARRGGARRRPRRRAHRPERHACACSRRSPAPRRPRRRRARLEPLTEREEDVLAAVARGLGNTEIAASCTSPSAP